MVHSTKKEQEAIGRFIVRNDRGLHTRPSTEIVKCASAFHSKIQLIHQGNEADAKSVLAILMLAAPKGARIQIKATGEDAEEAVSSLIALAENRFYIDY